MPAKSKSAGPENSRTDAITLLTDDHETVRTLLEEFAETTPRATKTRVQLLEKIAKEIRVHAQLEEEIFYPAYQRAAKSHDESKLYFEAVEEHRLVDIVLPELEGTDPSSEVFGARAKVLKDLVEHHADEEEDEMFPKAKKLLGKERLLELGAQLEARKEELTEGDGGLAATRRELKQQTGQRGRSDAAAR
jgi:hemerythrin-like domain-containing protein